MTDKLINTICGDATNYNDPDNFASDWATSSAVVPLEDETAEIDMALVAQLKTLWHVVNDPFRDFLRLLGLNQTQCAARFRIPLRTVQHWTLAEREAAAYIRIMMAELMGLIDLRDHAEAVR